MTEFNSFGDDSIAGVQPLFFRVADRMRLEGYVAALIDDNMSLSLVSSHDAILDHYGKLLVARLREAAPQIALEVYFPASAEALISRFNEVLQFYSVEEAMGSKTPVAPPKIWVVHDASALPDHEIQLLARLVQHFPAANIRVVMLLTTASKKQRLLASFGRRILNWEIEPPSEAQSQTLLEQARAQGREGAVSALLKKITPWYAPAAPVAAATPSPAPAEPTAVEPPAPAVPEAIEQASKAPRSLRKVFLWLGGVTGLLLVCALGVFMLYGGQQTAVLLGLASPKLAASAPVAPASAAASAPASSASAVLPPAAPSASTATTPVGGTNALGAGAAPAIAPTAKPAESLATARSAPAPASEVEEIITSPAQAQVGQAWVRQMQAGTFLVQHTIVPSYSEATLWMQAHPNLRRARIVATYLNGQAALQFAVVTGPFASLSDANNFAASPGVPRDPQIRSARSLKDHFAP
jgi:hypothetical protein